VAEVEEFLPSKCETLSLNPSNVKNKNLKKSEYTVKERLNIGQVWWCIPAIPELRRLRQDYHKFTDRLGYPVRACL
jgi:hypothetical protein